MEDLEDSLLSRLRLRERICYEAELQTTLSTQLVASLVIGDWPVVQAALGAAVGLRLNRKVCTPFSGASLFPLQAAVCAPMDPHRVLLVAERLLALGVDPNIRWTDCGGNYTPLAKALVLRNLPLAEVLVEHGADCTDALLRSDLLEGSRFDPTIVKWLLDRGAAVAPQQSNEGPAACISCGSSNGASPRATVGGWASPAPSPPSASSKPGCQFSAAEPAVAVLLSKLRLELHVSRQLSKLHAAAGSGQEQWLLQRSADCLTLLLAAGATPAGAPEPTGSLAAAVSALQPEDWAAVRVAASIPPAWSPATHHLFPVPFRLAAREVLLATKRGFTVPLCCSDGSPHGGQDSAHCAGMPQDQPCQVYLDGCLVLNIIKQMAPCKQT